MYAIVRSLNYNCKVMKNNREIIKKMKIISTTYMSLWICYLTVNFIVYEMKISFAIAVYILLSITVNSVFMQFNIILVMMNEYFKVINDNFISIFSTPMETIDRTTSMLIQDQSLTFGVQQKFMYLRSIYYSLCEISEILSKFYQLPMLVCILHALLTAIFMMYYPALSLLAENITIMYKLRGSLSALTVFVFYGFILTNLTASVTGIVNEVRGHFFFYRFRYS